MLNEGVRQTARQQRNFSGDENHPKYHIKIYRYSVEYEVYKNQENVLFELLKIVNSDLI